MQERAGQGSEWEYIRVLSGTDDDSLHDTMQKMGRDGWELVGAPPRGKSAQPLEAKASRGPSTKKNNKNRNMIYAALGLVAALLVFFTLVGAPDDRNDRITISQVVADVKTGLISKIVMDEYSD